MTNDDDFEGYSSGRDGDGGKGKGQDPNMNGGEKQSGRDKSFEPDDLPHNKRRRARQELRKNACNSGDDDR